MDIRVVKRQKKLSPQLYPEGIKVSEDYEEYLDIITSNDLLTICQIGIDINYIFDSLNRFSFAILVFEDDKIVALSTLKNKPSKNLLEIDILCSSVEGLGTKILKIIIEIAKLNKIKTIHLNTFSIELREYYKRFGFKVYKIVYDSDEHENGEYYIYYMCLDMKNGGGKRKTRKRRVN
jgi:hypothetical protein